MNLFIRNLLISIVGVFAWREPASVAALRAAIRGISEEASTGGHPSPSFGGFGFIVVISYFAKTADVSPERAVLLGWVPAKDDLVQYCGTRSITCRTVNLVCSLPGVRYVRFGSLAALEPDITRLAASEGKAVVRVQCFASAVVTSEKVTVNVRFSQTQSFR